MAGYLKGVSMCVCHSLGNFQPCKAVLFHSLAMFSHAILFSLLPRYLCEVSVVDFGSYLEPVRSTIHGGFGSYLETPVVWTWFCCMHVYLVDCIDLCAGMFSVGFFPPSLFFLAVKVFWVCGGFFP